MKAKTTHTHMKGIDRIMGNRIINYATNELTARDGRNWVEIPNTCTGDYTGCAVEKSNFQVLKERFEDTTAVFSFEEWNLNRVYTNSDWTPVEIPEGINLIHLSGFYSDTLYGLADDEEIQEIISALEDYPLLDEDHCAKLEWQIQEEYLKEIIEDVADQNAPFTATPDEIDEMLWSVWEFLDAENWYVEIEEGCLPYCRYEDEIKEMLIEKYFTK